MTNNARMAKYSVGVSSVSEGRGVVSVFVDEAVECIIVVVDVTGTVKGAMALSPVDPLTVTM